jgi:hypothetical protein
MKTGKWILYFCAIAFLLALPLISIVAGLAADLRQIHPVAGWATWAGTFAALLVLCLPIVRFLRLPALPPREVWEDESNEVNGDTWKRTALLLIRTSDEPQRSADLQRIIRDVPNSLPDELRKELRRRREKATSIRTSTMRQAAVLSILSPHRQLDFLILLWLNLKQVFLIGKCFGFKPSPRGVLQLYAGVFGSAMLIDAIDEVAEQTVAEGITRLSGSLPFVREASALAYEGIRSAAYVGLIGLLTDYLLQHELQKPTPSERKVMRRRTWKDAVDTIGDLRSSNPPAPTPETVQS